jgi:hypothetical protein
MKYDLRIDEALINCVCRRHGVALNVVHTDPSGCTKGILVLPRGYKI